MTTYFNFADEVAAVEAEAIKEGIPKDRVFGGKVTTKIILHQCGFTKGPAEVRRVALKFGHFER